MRFLIMIVIVISLANAFQIKPNTSKKIPKIYYTKIHDISYKSPIYIHRKRPFTFQLFKEISDAINNYINETYAMTSFPLSYNFANQYNETLID